MFRKAVQAISEGRMPLLFTGIEGDKLGHIALFDGASYGDGSILPASLDADAKLPMVQDGVLIERITTAPQLILCGGGHVSVQTAKVAKLVGFSVTVIDDRAEFANYERFPDADSILVEGYHTALERLHPSNAYYVIVTRGHKDDRACLEQILGKSFSYCGMIGSHTKVKLLFDDLEKNGFPRSLLDRVHSPIGLKIGANTPEEIAVCIVGEMIQVKNLDRCGVEWDEPLCEAIRTAKERYAMVTLIDKHGSAPRSTGARMIVRQDGTLISSVGGGFGEYQAAQYALQMLKSGPSVKRYTCNMNNTDAAKAGMVCGGSIDILIQLVEA